MKMDYNGSCKHKLQKPLGALGLLTALLALYSLTSDPGAVYYFDDEHFRDASISITQRQLEVQETEEISSSSESPSEPVTVCGRASDDIGSTQDLALQRKYATCPEYDPKTTPILVLEGYLTYGRTSNHLQSFLNAVQYTRDNGYQLGIMHHSWAMDTLLHFFMASGEDDWKEKMEAALCIKIIRWPEELAGREVMLKSTKALFNYKTYTPSEEYKASQLYTIRTLFQHYNTGVGHDQYRSGRQDMCLAIDSIFGEDERSSAEYSVIHLRGLEGDVNHIMDWVAMASGCDPNAGMDMMPEYIKALLAPLNMLDHPIIIITDGQNMPAVERLMKDDEIGSMIRLVPDEARWIGGDFTLAVTADAFIGNPASTFTAFIGESRMALGYKNTYTHMAKNDDGEWFQVCGDNCYLGGVSEKGEGTGYFEKHKGMTEVEGIRGSGLRFGKEHRLSMSEFREHKEADEASWKLRNLVNGRPVHAK